MNASITQRRLYGRDFFLQDQEGENNREEGGQFVQDRGVRYQKMVYGVIIAEYAGRSPKMHRMARGAQ